MLDKDDDCRAMDIIPMDCSVRVGLGTVGQVGSIGYLLVLGSTHGGIG